MIIMINTIIIINHDYDIEGKKYNENDYNKGNNTDNKIIMINYYYRIYHYDHQYYYYYRCYHYLITTLLP